MFGTCCCFCNRSAGGHDDYEDEDDQYLEIADRNNFRLVSKSRKEGSFVPIENSGDVQTWRLKRHPIGDRPVQWSFYTKRWDGRILYLNYNEKKEQIMTNIWRPNLTRYFTIHPSLESGRFLIKISGREKYLCSEDKKLTTCDSTGGGTNMIWQLKFRSPAQVHVEVFSAEGRRKWINSHVRKPIAVGVDDAVNAWVYQSLGESKVIFSALGTDAECVSYLGGAVDNELSLELKSGRYGMSFQWIAATEWPFIPTYLGTTTETYGDMQNGRRYIKMVRTSHGPDHLALTDGSDKGDALGWNAVVAQFC